MSDASKLALDRVLPLLVEEYRTLRQESLDALGHRLTVVSFTFAVLSVVLAGALSAASLPPLLVATVCLVFVPQAAKAGLFIWLGEYQRSQRAGRHLAALEHRMNKLIGKFGLDPVLTWESGLLRSGSHMSTPYVATIAFTVGVGWAGAFIGFWFLVADLRVRVAPGTALLITAAVAVLTLVWEILVMRRFLMEWRAARP